MPDCIFPFVQSMCFIIFYAIWVLYSNCDQYNCLTRLISIANMLLRTLFNLYNSLRNLVSYNLLIQKFQFLRDCVCSENLTTLVTVWSRPIESGFQVEFLILSNSTKCSAVVFNPWFLCEFVSSSSHKAVEATIRQIILAYYIKMA